MDKCFFDSRLVLAGDLVTFNCGDFVISIDCHTSGSLLVCSDPDGTHICFSIAKEFIDFSDCYADS